MKFVLLLLGVVGLAFVPAEANLTADILRFLQLVPKVEVMQIRQDYIQNDPAFAAADEFLLSDRMSELIVSIDSTPEFQTFMQFLEDKGIPATLWLNTVHIVMGWPVYEPPSKARTHRHLRVPREDCITPNDAFYAFINDVLNTLPMDEFISLWDELMATDEEFKNMVLLVFDPEFQQLTKALITNEAFMSTDAELKANCINIGADLKQIVTFFMNAGRKP